MLNLKNILIVLLGFVLLFNYYQGCNDKIRYEQSFKTQNDTVKHYKNSNGELVSSVLAYDVTLSEAKRLGLLKDKEIKKLKNLVSHTEVITITKDSLVTRLDTLILNDTVNILSFRFSDRWMKMDGTITDSVVIKYTIQEEFDVTTIRKAPSLFKKKVLVVDITSKNPHSLVTNIESIQIKEPPKKFYETKGFAFILGVLTLAIVK